MKAIKVEYTVKPEYVETNKANIQKVINEVSQLPDASVMYSVYIKEDGRSFIHFAIYNDADKPNVIPTLKSFHEFRDQLKAEGLASSIETVTANMVGKSFDF